jgi:DNA-binding cell septation regulator SpoVG
MISELHITPVKPDKGLVAFASLVLNKSIYMGSIAVFKKLHDDGYRITYPTKKVGEHSLNIYHPVDKEVGRLIEHAIVIECHRLFDGGA